MLVRIFTEKLIFMPKYLRGRGFPGGSVVKNLPANRGDVGLIPGSGRFPGEGNGYPLQYSCLGSPLDRGAWQITVHGVAKSWAQLSDERAAAAPYRKTEVLCAPGPADVLT